MYDILCVTNRKLCKNNFLEQIEKIAICQPNGIILREKDLNESEYTELAKSVINICKNHNISCILHSFVNTAIKLKTDKIHLPIHILRNLNYSEKSQFSVIGASVHSINEAIEAEKLGCTYITAGHIFSTDCKKDLEPRGLEFLNNVCKNVSVPVYGIGGIDKNNVSSVIQTGAKGVCIMSGLMQCENVNEYFIKLRGNV